MGDFKDLVVWGRSRVLVRQLYDATTRFPATETHGLVSQIRRAAVSIAANIAEGSGRQTDRDQARCYRIALSSARELENLLILSCDLELIPERDHAALACELDQIQRMLLAMIRHCLRGQAARGHRHPAATTDDHAPG